MASLLVNITSGPEHPFRAALGLLVAKTAASEGHEVAVFLAGDAVQLIREPVLDSLIGLGSGSAREHFDALVETDTRFYLSGMSSKARGVADADIEGKPAEMAMPDVLVRLIMESDKTVVY
jgi:predicted peroxiredoxin